MTFETFFTFIFQQPLFKNGRPTNGRMVCKKRAFYSTETSLNIEKASKSTTTLTSHIEKTFSSKTTSPNNENTTKPGDTDKTAKKLLPTTSKLPTPTKKSNSKLSPTSKSKKLKKNRSLCLEVLEDGSKLEEDTNSEVLKVSKRPKRNVSCPMAFSNGLQAPSSSSPFVQSKHSTSTNGISQKKHSPTGCGLYLVKKDLMIFV